MPAFREAVSLFTQSCMSNVTIEDVGRATQGAKMLQAYTLRDRELTREFIDRAREAGFAALCLTLDVPVPGMRERDLRYGLTVPPKLSPHTRSLANSRARRTQEVPSKK